MIFCHHHIGISIGQIQKPKYPGSTAPNRSANTKKSSSLDPVPPSTIKPIRVSLTRTYKAQSTRYGNVLSSKDRYPSLVLDKIDKCIYSTQQHSQVPFQSSFETSSSGDSTEAGKSEFESHRDLLLLSKPSRSTSHIVIQNQKRSTLRKPYAPEDHVFQNYIDNMQSQLLRISGSSMRKAQPKFTFHRPQRHYAVSEDLMSHYHEIRSHNTFMNAKSQRLLRNIHALNCRAGRIIDRTDVYLRSIRSNHR
jgi:hypothetical protein